MVGWPKNFLIIQKEIFFPFFCAIAHQNRSPELGFIAENRWFFFLISKKNIWRGIARIPLKIEVISSGSSVQELRFWNSMSTGSLGTGSRSPWSMQEGTRTLRDDWATATSCDCEFMSLGPWGRSSTEGNGACRKALEQSRMNEPLRPSVLSDINSQSQLVAVAQSS